MKLSVLKKYAKLIVRKGVNVQRKQDVVIFCSCENEKFASIVVKECYDAGASKVIVNWNSPLLNRISLIHQTEKRLSKLESFEIEKYKYMVEKLPAVICLEDKDPDGLRGINVEKMSNVNKAIGKVIYPYRSAMENHYQWCIVGIPSSKWAKKVFPNLNKSQATEKLWQSILYVSRVKDDPIKEWDIHNSILKEKCDFLNSKKFVSLHYKSNNGTDILIGLNQDGIWEGGEEKTVEGISFNPNIPSEEIFTSPKKGMAEGIVYSTKPLSYQGQIINDFSLKFVGGKIVEVCAKENEELLKKIIETDEGSSYLGECALVPVNSPINESGILFYSTLFDENASCHFAIGRGFAETIRGFEKLSREEIADKGINQSIIHVDFMIGSESLIIEGIDGNGLKTIIFENGKWK